MNKFCTFAAALFVVSLGTGWADSPRKLVAGAVVIGGKKVSEMALDAPLEIKRAKSPGGPTRDEYKILANHYFPVAEDADGVYFQARGRFRATPTPYPPQIAHVAHLGGFYLEKRQGAWIAPYGGDAKSLRLPVMIDEPLSPTQRRKLRVKIES